MTWDSELDGETFLAVTHACVYGWFRGSKCLYIGSSTKGIGQINKHLADLTVERVRSTDSVRFVQTKSIHDARELEKVLIARYRPFYNGSFTGRAYVTSTIVKRIIKRKN